MLSQSMENYLKAIFEILEKDDRATTSAIARRMDIAAPSATSMVKKLAEMKLLTHEPYQGVKLTPAGRKAALEVGKILETPDEALLRHKAGGAAPKHYQPAKFSANDTGSGDVPDSPYE